MFMSILWSVVGVVFIVGLIAYMNRPIQDHDGKHFNELSGESESEFNSLVENDPENPDVYFQGRETTNKNYAELPALVKKYLDKVGAKIGRKYNLFDYVGDANADKIIIAMGSACETIEETINYLNKKGSKLGLVKVRLYRPFSIDDLSNVIPKSVKKIAVLDRTKEPGAIGEPLFLDVVSALVSKGRNDIKTIGGRYGLSSKEFTPSMVKAVYDHLDGAAFHDFTVGIDDDITKKSLKVKEEIVTEPDDIVKCVFWGLGSDGTVGANKNSIKIIGDYTDMNAQGYFAYDSKKSGGITISYLRFGKSKIQSEYLITKADFVACHNPAYIGRYDMLSSLKENGVFLLNSEFSNDEVFKHLTKDMQETIIKKKIKFYNINAVKIADEVGLGGRINSVMQAAFFKISGVLPQDQSIKLIKDYMKKTYERKGDKVVQMNWDCVDKASAALQEIKVDAGIKESFTPPQLISKDADKFTKQIIEPIMYLKGDDIPVSHMPFDGIIPVGTTKLEKRGIATNIPCWVSDNCIQCNQCSLVCPHAAIRTKQIEPANLKNAPAGFKAVKSTTKNEKDLQYKVQVYIEDCTGCGNCVNVCPGKQGNKALVFSALEIERQKGERKSAEFFDELPDNILDGTTLQQFKGTQFKKPLFEFSGACAGCGETPYVKLVTQLFGERMIVANATGCSSIYGGTFPTVPYTVSKEGKGPAWGNSLFEDNAEYGFGFRLAIDANRKQLKRNIELVKDKVDAKLKAAFGKMLESWTKTDDETSALADEIVKLLPSAEKSATGSDKANLQKILELKDYILEKSVWAFGGDGWAYDIGYGGLDHVLACNKNINILVMDTEVYSNTGGQASKATPLGSIARFAEAGKRTGKKDLGLISMSYGYIYVASIALGANMAHAVKAIQEAEAYDGPSLIIAYAPCIQHGLAKGMGHTIEEEKLAVQAGYWPLYRYNPSLAQEGKNPFVYETKDPTGDMMEFLLSETRYQVLKKQFPDVADNLLNMACEQRKLKHEYYKKLSSL